MNLPISPETAKRIEDFCARTPEGQIVLTLRKGRVCSYKLTEHGEVSGAEGPRHRVHAQKRPGLTKESDEVP